MWMGAIRSVGLYSLLWMSVHSVALPSHPDSPMPDCDISLAIHRLHIKETRTFPSLSLPTMESLEEEEEEKSDSVIFDDPISKVKMALLDPDDKAPSSLGNSKEPGIQRLEFHAAHIRLPHVEDYLQDSDEEPDSYYLPLIRCSSPYSDVSSTGATVESDSDSTTSRDSDGDSGCGSDYEEEEEGETLPNQVEPLAIPSAPGASAPRSFIRPRRHSQCHRIQSMASSLSKPTVRPMCAEGNVDTMLKVWEQRIAQATHMYESFLPKKVDFTIDEYYEASALTTREKLDKYTRLKDLEDALMFLIRVLAKKSKYTRALGSKGHKVNMHPDSTNEVKQMLYEWKWFQEIQRQELHISSLSKDVLTLAKLHYQYCKDHPDEMSSREFNNFFNL